MLKEFKLPDLGEGLTESEILSWHVAVGDTVSLNQVIAEVETAKAVVELPSPYDGVVSAILEQPGTTVEVGSPIIAFELPEQSAPAQPQRVPTLVGYGADPESSGRPVRRRRVAPAAGAPQAPAAQEPVPEPAEPAVQQERPRSTPPVRKLARDLGVDLAAVPGSGKDGLIVREDVLAAANGQAGRAPAGQVPAGQAQPVPATGQPGAGEQAREVRTPIKGVRKHTAAAMVASAFTAPHVTEFLTVDVTAGMAFLATLKASREFAGLKLTPLTLLAKAVCLAVPRQPAVNSRWDEANAEIVTMNYVNLGIAAATPRGLMVPNIKDAQRLDLAGLARALEELTDTARAGKTGPADLSGGTISITNIGVFGIDAGTPILNPGEAAILAAGAVRRQPWVVGDQVVPRDVLTLSLSFDHRLVDGEQGSRFLADIGRIVSDPAMVLAMI